MMTLYGVLALGGVIFFIRNIIDFWKETKKRKRNLWLFIPIYVVVSIISSFLIVFGFVILFNLPAFDESVSALISVGFYGTSGILKWVFTKHIY